MELNSVFEALETLREFCMDQKHCEECALYGSQLCDIKHKLSEIVFNDPSKPAVFRFFSK